MIYKINGSLVPTLTTAKFIIFSSNGEFALVRSESFLENAIEQYTENELSVLLSSELYRQPCVGC